MDHYNQDVKNRLKRIEGQVRGVLRMMEEQTECREVVTQLSAIRSAVDRAIGVIVAKNLEACIKEREALGESADDIIQEAVNMIVRSR
ncbi:MAG: metal-sensitive transcriptional regulator [Bacillales bacterium]|jgi:DNA-binding FrmR family transcriptional regulator|nr:metal-sensitive transcriptional regulator [Bacillales bacterium]